MPRTAFENLDVYRLAEKLAQAVWRTVVAWKPFDWDTLGKQLVRAADGIGANVAEGFGRGNGPDHKRFIRIARGSICEVRHWLRLAYGVRTQSVAEEDVNALKPILDELPPRLNAYIRAIGRDRSTTVNNQHSTIKTR